MVARVRITELCRAGSGLSATSTWTSVGLVAARVDEAPPVATGRSGRGGSVPRAGQPPEASDAAPELAVPRAGPRRFPIRILCLKDALFAGNSTYCSVSSAIRSASQGCGSSPESRVRAAARLIKGGCVRTELGGRCREPYNQPSGRSLRHLMYTIAGLLEERGSGFRSRTDPGASDVHSFPAARCMESPATRPLPRRCAKPADARSPRLSVWRSC